MPVMPEHEDYSGAGDTTIGSNTGGTHQIQSESSNAEDQQTVKSAKTLPGPQITIKARRWLTHGLSSELHNYTCLTQLVLSYSFV